MNFRTTLLIIAVLVVVSGTYFLFLNKPIDEKTENKKPRIHQVYDLPIEKIQKLKLSYSDSTFQTFSITKNTDNNWRFITPIVAHADVEKVNVLLDDFLTKRVKQTLQVSDYDQYGLDNPTITVELWKENSSEPITFFIGKKGINYSVYIKKKFETHIFLIESSALDDLLKSPSDMRDRSVIKINPDSITKIQFMKPEELQCQKEGDLWKMTQPISVNADTQKIQHILSALHTFQVSTFEADNDDVKPLLEKYGLNKARIEMTLKDGESTYGLQIGSEVLSEQNDDHADTRVYVRSIHQGGIYTVSNNITELLNKSVFDLRDRRVLDFQRGETTKFEIQRGTKKIVGIKLGKDAWELISPNKIKADSQAVSDLLFGVDSLEAVEFVSNSQTDLAFFGFEPSIMQVSFAIQGENKPAVLHIGNYADENSVFVKTDNSEQIVRVKRELIDNIAKGNAWLRNKQIFNFTIEKPIRLTVKYVDKTHEDGMLSFTCQRLGSNWRLTSPVKESANNSEVNGILYELIDLKAVEYVTGTLYDDNNKITDGKTGLNSPQIQIMVELRPQKLFILQIGKVDSTGHYYARLKSDPNQIFLLNQEVIPKLKTKLEWLRPTVNE